MVRGVLSTEAPGGCDSLSASLLFMMVSRTQQFSRRPRRPPPSHHAVFALLWLDSPSAFALRAALEEAGLNPQSLLSRFHLTVYHARESIPGLRPLRRTVSIDCNLSETRTMVLVPGGENPRRGVIPSQHSLALRLTTRNVAVPEIQSASGREAGQEEIMRKVSEDLTRALEKAMAYEEAENTRLDRQERYRRESRKQWRICGNR